MNKILIKRPVTIKTIVTQKFKAETEEEFLRELNLIDVQIMQIEKQIREFQDNQQYSKRTDFIEKMGMSIDDVTRKLEQLVFLKQELIEHNDTIENLKLEEHVITGNLENYFELKVGDNLYDKFKVAEIIVRDGIIEEINL